MCIPKIIHYCWFGGNPLPELAQKCIASWKKHCPDYEIIEWNESNFDLSEYLYAKEAYEAKKYAFVSDVARFHILKHNGGIYLDTDVELLKPLNQFLENRLFMGFDRNGAIASGLIVGSIQNHPFLDKILDFYRTNHFFLSNGRANTTSVLTIVTELMVLEGITLTGKLTVTDGITLYPSDYFDPFDYEKNKMHITSNTCSIHHYAASWKSPMDMKIYRAGLILKKIIGKRAYKEVARLKHKIFG